MPRQRRKLVSTAGTAEDLADAQRAADEVDAWTRPSKPPSKGAGFGNASMVRAARALDEIIKTQEWVRARPIHFVVLYARMHEHVYDISPVWTSEDRRLAAMAIGGTISRYFEGPAEFAEYMRWLWRREKETEKWRRENKKPGRIIGWRLQCNTSMINEYRVSVVRGLQR